MPNVQTETDIFDLSPGKVIEVSTHNNVYTLVTTDMMELVDSTSVSNIALLSRSQASIKQRDRPKSTVVPRVLVIGQEFKVSNSKWLNLRLGPIRSIGLY